MDGATYDRPTKATLVVRLENGEEWEATPADLARFHLAHKLDIYVRASDMLVEGLGLEEGTDLTRAPEHEGANLVRYLMECAICYDHSPWANEDGEPWPEDETEGLDFQARLQGLLLPRHG